MQEKALQSGWQIYEIDFLECCYFSVKKVRQAGYHITCTYSSEMAKYNIGIRNEQTIHLKVYFSLNEQERIRPFSERTWKEIAFKDVNSNFLWREIQAALGHEPPSVGTATAGVAHNFEGWLMPFEKLISINGYL